MSDAKFITVNGLARQFGVCRHTIMRRIKEGIYPPLPGNQLSKQDQAWPKIYWDDWFKRQSANADKTQKNLAKAIGQAN